MSSRPTCPDCDGEVYRNSYVPAGPVGYSLLPGLGGFLQSANLRVFVCADCGLTRLFADSEARAKVKTSSNWDKLP